MILLSNTGQDQLDNLNGRKIYRINVPSHSIGRKGVFSFISQTIDILNKEDFDIVHIHSSCPYFALYKILSESNAKFIYHSLSYPLWPSKIKRIKQMLFIFFQCILMDRVIFQTEEAKMHWIGLRNFNRTDIVPVGFDKDVLYPINQDKKRQFRKHLNIDESEPLLVFCGAISKFRQLDQLIRAFEKVHRTFEGAKLLVIGDGDDLGNLKDLSQYLKIESSIIFTGRVPHELLVNYISMADIGLSYVPINESYTYNPPLKTFEYLACGLLTIATKTDANCKIIKDGLNGILVDDSPEDISTTIIDLLRDSENQVSLRENARDSIMSFDFSRIAKKYLIPVYDRLLSDN
jgi:glycosyltransferase involved in cell wall biosynthesis